VLLQRSREAEKREGEGGVYLVATKQKIIIIQTGTVT